MVWSVSDGAEDPFWRVDGLTPSFEGSAPAEVAWQVFGGDAVEAVEPLLEAAVVGVDIVDVEVGRLGSWLARRGRGVEGNAGAAGEAGDRQAAVADEVIGRRDEFRPAPR